MIDVIFKEKDEKLISFSVTGHAEYCLDGEVIYDDVVCGAVSTLAQTAIIGVVEVLKLNVLYRVKDGDIVLDILEGIDRCQVLFLTILLSFRSLEISYGEYIKVSVEEVQ